MNHPIIACSVIVVLVVALAMMIMYFKARKDEQRASESTARSSDSRKKSTWKRIGKGISLVFHHPIKTIFFLTLSIWLLALAVAIVQLLLSPNLKEEIFGKAQPVTPYRPGFKEYKLNHQSNLISVEEGTNFFTLRSNQVCRMELPGFGYYGKFENSGDVYMRTKDNFEWRFFSPESTNSVGKSLRWVEIKAADPLKPVDVSLIITQRF